MSDSFFDMPAGYSDADLEMSALEAEGNRRYRLLRWATPEQRATLEAGGTVDTFATIKATRERYPITVRLEPVDFVLDYSVDQGATWHDRAKDARLASENSSV